MRTLSPLLQARFIAHLTERMVPGNVHPFYVKWLRYYLDFCEKYHCPHEQRTSLKEFFLKLRAKKQTPAQQQQAAHAVSLYYELLQPQIPVALACSPQQTMSSIPPKTGSVRPSGTSTEPAPPPRLFNSTERSPVEQSHSPGSSQQPVNVRRGVSWKEEYAKLTAEIKLRHYSPKTLRACSQWVRHYQTFTRSQAPKEITAEHVKQFLTSLAVEQKVSASTQNQAFNALLFFHRHVLKKEFAGWKGSFAPSGSPTFRWCCRAMRSRRY